MKINALPRENVYYARCARCFGWCSPGRAEPFRPSEPIALASGRLDFDRNRKPWDRKRWVCSGRNDDLSHSPKYIDPSAFSRRRRRGYDCDQDNDWEGYGVNSFGDNGPAI